MTSRTLPPCVSVTMLDRLLPAIHRPLRYCRAAIVAVNYDCEGRPIDDLKGLMGKVAGRLRITRTEDKLRADWTWDDGRDRVEMALFRISDVYCTHDPEEDFDRFILIGSPVDMDGAPEMEWSIPITGTERRMTIVTSASKPVQRTLEAYQ